MLNLDTYIIILNYNSSDESIRLYNDVKKYHRELGIIIVDNGSINKDINNLRLNINNGDIILNNFNYGYAKGNNIGIRYAIEKKARYVFILNPDIEIDKNTITELIKVIKSEDKIAAVGPRICYRNNKSLIYSDGGILDKKTYKTSHLNHNKNIDSSDLDSSSISYINGSAILIDVNALLENGLFIEDFFLYYEETEWCNRVLKNGWRIKSIPKAVVYHKSSTKGSVFHYYLVRNRIMFVKIDNGNVKIISREILKSLIREFFFSLRNLSFPKNYYLHRLKGFISGILYKVK